MSLPELDKARIHCVFTRSDALLGKLIRLGEGGGKVNHVLFYVHIWDEDLCGWYDLGANTRGLYPRFVGEDNPLEDAEVVEVFECPAEVAKGLHENRGLIGQPYDFGGILGMVPVEVAERVFHVRIKNLFQSTGAVFCSEFAAKVFADSGIELPLRRGEKPSTIDPEELRRALPLVPGFRLVYEASPRPAPQPAPKPEARPYDPTMPGREF